MGTPAAWLGHEPEIRDAGRSRTDELPASSGIQARRRGEREVRDQVERDLLPRVFVHETDPGVSLTGRAPDHGVEASRRRSERRNVSAPEKIRTPYDDEALLLESSIEHPDSREQ